MLSSFLSLSFLALSAHSAPSPFTRRATAPSQDPFYIPPAGFESAAPGTVFASRSVDVSSFGFKETVQAWQLLYRTESQNGTAMATVTTVFRPPPVNSHDPYHLLAWNIPEDASSFDCSPSYLFNQGETGLGDSSTTELSAFLSQGWIVTAPDYEGPSSAFGAGRIAGKGVLDAVRATLGFRGMSLTKFSKVGITGYSGGAIAAGWTAALQPTYAPELNIVAVAQGGTPANSTGTSVYLDGTLYAGFAVGGIAGFTNSYKSINTLWGKIATQHGKEAVEFSNSHCTTDMLIAYAYQKIQSTVFTSAGDRLLYLPEVQKVGKDNTLGLVAHETPTAPLYVYHAVNDEIIPIVDTETMVASYCSNHIHSLIFDRITGDAGHTNTYGLNFANVIAFLSGHFAGIEASKGCTIRDVDSSTLSSASNSTSDATLNALQSKLLQITQDRIGLKNDNVMKETLRLELERKADAAKRA
ncbi:LIP-domain-containing protein [Atractiella rhizophila]|nr:LIP-domain-containing protein [Atractiella rhizophila]